MDTRHKKQAMLGLTAAMMIFGTIGIFRRYIALSSGMLSFGRGALGALYLLLWMHGRGRRLPGSMTRR